MNTNKDEIMLDAYMLARGYETHEREAAACALGLSGSALLARIVQVLDAYEGGCGLVSNQGQAMDGYSALANFKAIAEDARDLLANTED